MTNLSEPPVLARAATRRTRRVSVIWLIPLVAVAIGAWLAWDTLSKEGPTITVTFNSGEGLQAGQSQLKYKDIVFGTVKSLELAPDHSHVIVTLATTHQAEPLLTDKTVFWVVKPRLFAGNISGLETLLSGSYVGMLPGAPAGSSNARLTESRTRRSLQSTSQAMFSCSRPSGWVPSSLVRRSFSAIRMSAKCSAGTSPTWRNM